MSDTERWLQWAKELQSLAQAGLYYSGDRFDIERFQRIREISAEMLGAGSGLPTERVTELFCCERGYQTPKIGVRCALFDDAGRILLVRESDGRWTLPGGWCDVNLSPAENAVKEIREEAGLTASVESVIAVQDHDKHHDRKAAFSITIIFFLCRSHGGEFAPNSETTASGYFDLKSLPPLADMKCTREQIAMCFEANRSRTWTTLFD